MLRDNTELFASEFSDVLRKLGAEDAYEPDGFQLQKFERIEPDVFIWMLSGMRTYVVTIIDGGSHAPDKRWLAEWSGGVKVEDFELLVFDDESSSTLEDGYDFIQVYRLPQDYDHTDLY
jgi:hypothetical protein